MKEIEESIKNIEDPELRLKKKLELMELKQVEKFMGEDTDQTKEQKEEEINLNFALKTEKDYINLAQKSAAKINQVNKSNKNVYQFVKSSMEILLPTLNEDLINNLKNAVIFLKNKKDKKDDKKKKPNEEKKEPVPKSDRFEERKEKENIQSQKKRITKDKRNKIFEDYDTSMEDFKSNLFKVIADLFGEINDIDILIIVIRKLPKLFLYYGRSKSNDFIKFIVINFNKTDWIIQKEIINHIPEMMLILGKNEFILSCIEMLMICYAGDIFIYKR